MSSDDLLTYSKELHEAALAGDASAQVDLALCYSQGWGVAIDHAKAVQWYTLAAEQGHRAALHSLGLKFMLGEGVERDPFKAAEYWQRAADLGFAMSMYLLAFCYKTGDGVPKDGKMVSNLLERAAKLDYPPAMYEIGKRLWKSSNGDPDLLKLAYHWLFLAYEMGIYQSEYSLNGIGSYIPDRVKARIRKKVYAERDRIQNEGIYLYKDYLGDDDDGRGDDGDVPPPPEGLFTGGDGSSFENAVIINETRSSFGVSAEYYYINLLAQQKGQSWRMSKQSLTERNGIPYDILDVIWEDGSVQSFHFDISAFHGRRS